MSSYIEKAKEILEKANKEFTEMCGIIVGNNDNLEEGNLIYQTTSQLNVLVSQFIDYKNPRTIEGNIVVNNRQAMVSIDGFEIRGNIEFEIWDNDKWVKGRRENSQYGQTFTGNNLSKILSSNDKGRVSFPLRIYS